MTERSPGRGSGGRGGSGGSGRVGGSGGGEPRRATGGSRRSGQASQPPGTDARALAVEALVRVETGGYSNLVLPGLLRASRLDSRDRALVTDLVYGTLRQQGQADHLLALASHRPLPELDPPVRAALRLGAYQLLAGTPPHAAVSATVEALAGWSSPASVRRAAAYANAVLRRVAGLGPPWPWPGGDDAGAVAVRTSHPRWIVELLRRDLGDEAEAVLAAANEAPVVTLRPNPRRTTPEALAAELASVAATAGTEARPGDGTDADARPGDARDPDARGGDPGGGGPGGATAGGIHVERGRLVPSALLVRGAGDLARLPAVADGRATPQDQASQAVAAAVGARPGEHILDLAAAPGGKATAMAEAMGDDGLVVATDLRPGRAARVRDAALRLGLRSVQAIVADGRHLPLRATAAPAAPWPGNERAEAGAGGGVPEAGAGLGRRPAPAASSGLFDRVLLDAPCSGLGVLRRRPEARWRLEPIDIERAAGLQRELFSAAAARLRPGGLLAYCVCTLTRAETVEIDDWAAAAFPALVAVPGPGAPWRPHGRGALLLPHVAGSDGMFLLLLRSARPAGADAPPLSRSAPAPPG